LKLAHSEEEVASLNNRLRALIDSRADLEIELDDTKLALEKERREYENKLSVAEADYAKSKYDT
jgi:hypothetical protein